MCIEYRFEDYLYRLLVSLYVLAAPRHCLMPFLEGRVFTQMTVERNYCHLLMHVHSVMEK